VLPSKQRFEEGKIVIKGWAKHPLLKEYSSSEITQSWKNDFLYKEEDKNEAGLRQPQIAALHMIMGHLKLPLDAATVVMPTGTVSKENYVGYAGS
jgi:type I site-specific restriction endonuclease